MIFNMNNSLVDDINKAKATGYAEEFMFTNNSLFARNSNRWYELEQCYLVEYQQQDGMSSPEDTSILFLITTDDNNMGCLSSNYGVHADPELMEFMRKMKRFKQVDIAS